MSRTSSFVRQGIFCGVAIVGAVGFSLASLPANADWYRAPSDTHSNEFAAQLDPFDPVPEIGRGCRGDRDCDHDGGRHHFPPPGPALPGILGHNAVLVDCGMFRSDPRRGVFSSVNEAVHFVPPNGTVLIVPPGDGTTCVETVFVDRPVTIATYGGGKQAVIEAPSSRDSDGDGHADRERGGDRHPDGDRGRDRHSDGDRGGDRDRHADGPCLIAHIPLGDTLTIDGVRFVSRTRDKPCVSVEAGHVIVRNSSVDSRGTNWAFDVRESGELSVESTRIETDASGVHARRAHVDLHNLDIAIEARNGAAQFDLGRTDCTDKVRGTIQGSVGLALECTDGTVEGGHIIGGAVGILASSGTHGLRLSDINVTKADTGVLLLPGQLGSVDVQHLALSKNRDGLIVGPGAESQITGSVITDSDVAGIAVYGPSTLISGNKVVGAGDGIRLLAADAFPPNKFPDFAAIPVIGDSDGGPIVENNLVANVREAAVRIDGRARGHMVRMRGRVIGNTFYAHSHAVCIDDRYNDDPVQERANVCNRGWLPWPF